jgi:hypothetical protein
LSTALGEDVFINFSNPDLDDDAYDYQAKLEDRATEFYTEEEDPIYDDAMII